MLRNIWRAPENSKTTNVRLYNTDAKTILWNRNLGNNRGNHSKDAKFHLQMFQAYSMLGMLTIEELWDGCLKQDRMEKTSSVGQDQ